MSTLIQSGREVVQCWSCHLTQFRTTSNLCRKCRSPLDGEQQAMAEVPAEQPVSRLVAPPDHSPDFGFALLILRRALRLSQPDVARRGGFMRTYISKVENRRAMPNIESIYRLAEALGVPAFVLVTFASFHMYAPAVEEQKIA